MKQVMMIAVLAAAAAMTGCASVPMASPEKSAAAKAFPKPDEGKAGVYVYRDSFVGKALKKDVFINGRCLGESADRVFFYAQVDGGKPATVSTESEFSPNDLIITPAEGDLVFIRQSIKMGVFVGGAGLSQSTEQEGKRVISKPEVKLAENGHCSN